MKSSDLFVKCLENEGVEYIFGIAGEENLDLLDSLARSRIKFITTRHEQAAAFMAATYGRLTGNPGVVLSTLGPGATNLMTGVAYAQLGAMPMVVITAQKAANSEDGPRFQRVDVIEMIRPVSKMSVSLSEPDDIPRVIRSAFELSLSGRPGVTHIELPEDVAKKVAAKIPLIRAEIKEPVAEQAVIDQAASMISEANKPLVMFGGMACRNGNSKALSDFIKQTGIPFFTTQLGKGAVDERSDLYLGTASDVKGLPLHEIIKESDLIISIGYDSSEKQPYVAQVSSANVLNVNAYVEEESSVRVRLNVIGETGETVSRLSSAVKSRNYWKGSTLSEFKLQQLKVGVEDVRSLSSDLFGGGMEDESYELDPYEAVSVDGSSEEQVKLTMEQLIVALQSVMSKNSIVCLDNGLYKLEFAEKYRAVSWNSVLLDNSLATMGAGLPSAIAAKLLYPKSQVVAVVGDGGFMMSSQELETMSRIGLAVKIIIIDDNGFGMIRWKQEAEGLRENGLKFGNPEWSKYVESFGIKYVELSDPDTLQGDLKRALVSRGSVIMHMSVDYSKFY